MQQQLKISHTIFVWLNWNFSYSLLCNQIPKFIHFPFYSKAKKSTKYSHFIEKFHFQNESKIRRTEIKPQIVFVYSYQEKKTNLSQVIHLRTICSIVAISSTQDWFKNVSSSFGMHFSARVHILSWLFFLSCRCFLAPFLRHEFSPTFQELVTSICGVDMTVRCNLWTTMHFQCFLEWFHYFMAKMYDENCIRQTTQFCE